MTAVTLAKGKFWWWDVHRVNPNGTWTWVDSGFHLTYAGALRASAKVK